MHDRSQDALAITRPLIIIERKRTLDTLNAIDIMPEPMRCELISWPHFVSFRIEHYGGPANNRYRDNQVNNLLGIKRAHTSSIAEQCR